MTTAISGSAGGFDNLAHVRQVFLEATWISAVSYNPNASLALKIFSQGAHPHALPAGLQPEVSSRSVRGWGYQVSGSFQSESDL